MIGAEGTPLEVEKWGPSIFAIIIFGLSTKLKRCLKGRKWHNLGLGVTMCIVQDRIRSWMPRPHSIPYSRTVETPRMREAQVGAGHSKKINKKTNRYWVLLLYSLLPPSHRGVEPTPLWEGGGIAPYYQ